jgi:hypothetical protein
MEAEMSTPEQTCTAFDGDRRIAAGSIVEVALALKARVARHADATVLVFDDATGRQIDFDLRGSDQDLIARLSPGESVEAAPAARGPGRPKLGVVAREVTLLPRHWEWLNAEPGGASVALRKLVEAARTANPGREAVRRAQAAADRFMSAVAGNLPRYEDASRALYAGNRDLFIELTEAWPADIRAHARHLASAAFRVPAEA